ncbi:glycosyltransferase family 15 protein [Lactarius pseudohatsudake]|nr:glycosyltransferase family 15 protein [Lactarius pseudohatsudake]
MPLSVIRRNVLSIVAVSIVAVLSLARVSFTLIDHYINSNLTQTILYTLTDPPGHLRLLPLTSPLATDATLLVVCEDSDLGAVLTTMQQIEDRFNAQARYPWTFLCDEPLTEDFTRRVSTMTDSLITFNVIPAEHWGPPDWINGTRAEQTTHGIIGESTFNMALREMEQTVSTLWEAVYDFMQEHKLRINTGSNLAGLPVFLLRTKAFLDESSFEVVDMKFLRSPAYLTFFDYLDKKGGIFYEEKLFFQDSIGYRHGDIQHCPQGDAGTGRCACDPKKNFGEKIPSDYTAM